MELSPEVLAWMARLNKEIGPGTIVLASDIVIPKRFPSGSLALDVALGGGWPGNQWVEVVGQESSGKTYCVLKTIAANQKLDPAFMTFWVAAEHYDTDQATALGVDNERVVVAPASQRMEIGLELLLEAVESKVYDCLVLDSFPALLPKEEEEKAMSEFVVSVGAKLFNKFWRKAGESSNRASDGSDRPFLGIVINQFRDKVGGFQKFGVPQTSPGGHGKDYAFYTRLKVARDEFITEKRPGLPDPVVVGQVVAFKTIKNKSAAPQQTAKVRAYTRNAPFLGFHRGDYDLGEDYIQMGKLFGVIQVTGSWLHYAGQKWQSKDAMADAIREDLDLQAKLAAEVLEVAADPHRADDMAQRSAEAATAPTRSRRKRTA